MSPAATKKRRPAAERARELREQIEQARRPDLETDAVREARADLEAAEQALRELPPHAAHPDHPGLTRRVENCRRRYRTVTSALGSEADQRAAELERELQAAEAAAQRETAKAWTRMTDAARERAAADERTVEHAASDFDHLRAGLCRLLIDRDADLAAVAERFLGRQLGAGEAVVVAVGGVSERRPDDRRPVMVLVTVRRPSAASTLSVPLDRLERIPEGMAV